MKRTELRLVPHDPAWRDDFLAEQRRILNAAGDSVRRIEHVGSTAIPTVWAKPILDIALLCGAGGIGPVADALTSIGYDFRGRYDDTPGHFYAVLDHDGVRYCQAHIYSQANDDWDTKLLFRDVLSRDAELAREYNEFKLALAETAANKRDYAETKSRWVDTFIVKVKASSAADHTPSLGSVLY